MELLMIVAAGCLLVLLALSLGYDSRGQLPSNEEQPA